MAGNEQVPVEIITHRPNAANTLNDLRALGLRESSQVGRLISGVIPIRKLVVIDDLTAIRYLRPVYARTHTGSVTSQGDVALRGDLARTQFGVDGSGVTVGILSDSFDTAADPDTTQSDDIATGDLPPTVTILQDYSPGSSDEGRAMAQLIYDVVPGLDELQFHTAFNSIADFADGIHELAEAGSDIIVDDIIYLAEPMFQDGLIAQAVDNVTTEGISYFSSAGNSARQSYEASFQGVGTTELGSNGRFHDFAPNDATTDVRQSVTIPSGGFVTVVLQWSDPFLSVSNLPEAEADTDLDLFLVEAGTDTILASSQSLQATTGDPLEIISYENSATSEQSAELLIQRSEGPDPERIKYVYFDELEPEEFLTRSATAYGHANAAGAIAVGATAYFNTPEFGTTPPQLEDFSSAGGIELLFETNGSPIDEPELREKPEITAPDGGNTTFFGNQINDGDGFPNFFGTSAAAPHAAAVAALMLDVDPNLTPTEVENIMRNTAADITARDTDVPTGAGFDFDSGAGLIQADKALESIGCTLSASPASVDFGSVPIGDTATEGLTLENTGTANCEITSIALTGNPAFALATPPTTPLTLLAGDTERVEIDFDPTSTGSVSTTLEVTSDAPASPTVVPISGTGQGECDLDATPNAVDFGAVDLGQAATLDVTLANSGTGDCSVSAFTLTGDPDFGLAPSPGTPFNLGPTTQQTVTVEFTPEAIGTANGNLDVDSNDPNSPLSVPLAGEGIGECTLSASPASVDFGSVPIGDTATEGLTLENTGTANCEITSIALTGNPAFALATPPTTPLTLLAGDTERVEIDFDPTSTGSVSTRLDVRSSDGTVTVTLTGEGQSAGSIPGDLDGDGAIDSQDRDLFFSVYGSSAGTDALAREVDYNNNGVVEYGDFIIWRRIVYRGFDPIRR